MATLPGYKWQEQNYVRVLNTTQSGIWNVSSGINPWAGQSLYSATVNATFRWIPLLPLAGSHQVYTWWTYRASRSTAVPYQIQHQAGTTTVTVNQQDEALESAGDVSICRRKYGNCDRLGREWQCLCGCSALRQAIG
jgi:hypothetical protein